MIYYLYQRIMPFSELREVGTIELKEPAPYLLFPVQKRISYSAVAILDLSGPSHEEIRYDLTPLGYIADIHPKIEAA